MDRYSFCYFLVVIEGIDCHLSISFAIFKIPLEILLKTGYYDIEIIFIILKTMINLGLRLRELRIARGMTLEEVAAGTGLSVSFLSLVERDKASISVDNLEKIADFFQIHLVHFFTDERPELLTITRREQIFQKLSLPSNTPTSLLSLSRYSQARMEPLLISIAPGKEEPHFRLHDADVLLYVIQGEMLLIGENGEEHCLETGDIAYYVNTIRRRIKNLSQENPLFVILITAPPTSSLRELRATGKEIAMPPDSNP